MRTLTGWMRAWAMIRYWHYFALALCVLQGCGSEGSGEVTEGPVDASGLEPDEKALNYQDIDFDSIDNVMNSNDAMEPLYHGSYAVERIEEKAPPSGKTRYYSTGYYYDAPPPNDVCGGEWPYDTILKFSLDFNQCPDPTRLRIYATNSGALCAIPGYVDARVYSDGHVDACVGWYRITKCFADSELMKKTTYLWYD